MSSFYKLMLGKTLSLADLEGVDAEYHRNLSYIIDNDPEPLCLTMSIVNEAFGQTETIDLVPNGI